MAQELKDDPAKEWCYLKKSTTALVCLITSQVTEVTYDGALYTGYIELNFAAGSKAAPLLLRQKRFRRMDSCSGRHLEGRWSGLYHPDVWSSGYARGYFNCLNFVKISVKNNICTRSPFGGFFTGKLDDSFVELQDLLLPMCMK